MILLFLIDLILLYFFNFSAYLTIGYIPFLKKSEIPAYFILQFFISSYYMGNCFIYFLIISLNITLVSIIKKHYKKDIFNPWVI